MTLHRASARPSRTSRPGRRRAAACALLAASSLVGLAVTAGTAAAAATPVLLGTASPYAVLAATTVTNTGSSVLGGDLGVSPGLAVTGFPPGLVLGSTHAGDAVAGTAQDDLRTAYDAAAGQARDTTVSADLGGQVFLPGVHGSSSSLGLTGTVTLDAQGDPDAVFVFQAGSTLTTAAASRVLLVDGASACNVFWQVGSSATLGASTSFVGSLLVLASASLGTGTTVDGRVLARTGAVTLDTDVVTRPVCAATTPGGTTPTTTAPPTTAPTTTAPTTTAPTTAPAAPPADPAAAPTGPTAPAAGPAHGTGPTTAPAGGTVAAPEATSPAPSGSTGTPTGAATATTGAATGTPGRTTTTVTTRTTGRTTGQRLTDGPGVTGGPVVPRGAPATGGGGTAPAAGSPLLAAGLLALVSAVAVAGLTGPRRAPARHRSS